MIAADNIFTGKPVSLFNMLSRREVRVQEQQEALKTGCPCIISFCLNMPGPIKNFPLAEKAFSQGCAALYDALGDSLSLFKETKAETGCEAIFLCKRSAREIKALTVSLEESHPLGRLFDMDVLSEEGHLSRTDLQMPPRKCLLCSRNASVCGRSRAHSAEELRMKIAAVLETYFSGLSAEKIAQAAYDAMLKEVNATPKPGLVDLHDNGAHTDMDPDTFYRSAKALRPWIRELYLIGRETSDKTPEALFILLREAGRKAEQAMFAATGGVNTHKGLLFSLALLAGAAGRLQAGSDRPLGIEEWTREAASLGRCSLCDLNTDMAVCYRLCGAAGARGEAANGFPSVKNIALPVFTNALSSGSSFNYAAVRTLIALIASVEDSNMLRRGGQEKALLRRRQAKLLLSGMSEDNYLETVSRLNEEYIADHLSPGGCADLLVLTIFLTSFTSEELRN